MVLAFLQGVFFAIATDPSTIKHEKGAKILAAYISVFVWFVLTMVAVIIR